MKNDLGLNKIIQEYRGKRVELSQEVIGPDVHDFMDMIVNFMLATGWDSTTIQSGLESAVEELESRNSTEKESKENLDE
jgi:hypothetical protein